jgi:Flp pilus assembly protein TadB
MSQMPDDRRAGLEPPQFRLSTLLYAVALLAVLCALVSYFGLHSALVLILFALAIAAHVAGNALGTQLRANGDKPLPGKDGKPTMQWIRRPPTADEFAPATELGDRRSLGRPIVIATISGGVLTAVLGGILLLTILQRTPTLVALIGGTVACGALGAFWTFLAFGFVQVAWGAICQATEKVDPHRKTPNPG